MLDIHGLLHHSTQVEGVAKTKTLFGYGEVTLGWTESGIKSGDILCSNTVSIHKPSVLSHVPLGSGLRVRHIGGNHCLYILLKHAIFSSLEDAFHGADTSYNSKQEIVSENRTASECRGYRHQAEGSNLH